MKWYLSVVLGMMATNLLRPRGVEAWISRSSSSSSSSFGIQKAFHLGDSHHAVATTTTTTLSPITITTPRRSTRCFGWMDALSKFLTSRDGDFVKLEESNDRFGPGPLLLLYNVPSNIVDEEIRDMIEDGAPNAQNCIVTRIDSSTPELELSLEEALVRFVSGRGRGATTWSVAMGDEIFAVPVLFFSGFRNDEMMNVYNILGREIFQETGGRASPACAKAVPRAMDKPLKQVLDEISGDHKVAMSMDSEGT